YWGEAMTYNHPLWHEQDQDAALKVLARLTPSETLTPLEKGFLSAVEVLYGKGEKLERDRLYCKAMRGLYEEFPKDTETATFYALSILGSTPERNVANYMKAAAILEEVYAAHPDHPGAVHYLIHCYDDPIHAPLGLRVARQYAKLAPASAHALHMPSHIFLALG